jgi:cation diffusion facilitator CzcD-associated flavoprotein CzcO
MGKRTPTIAIAGAGFGGIGLAIALKKAGIESFTIYERAAEVGGVWRDNAYPGAACDVPSRLYSYSFEPEYPWSTAYGRGPEIKSYIERCVAKYGLAPHIRFGANIVSAAFDAAAREWRLETAGGERIAADVFVSAVGLFNKPALPDIPGRESFAGPSFHSARWNHDVDLRGKTVAVIGTGASAVQFVPAIAKDVARLHLFQRTPQYVMPKIVRDDDIATGSRLAHAWERFRLFLTFEKAGRRRGSDRLIAESQAAFLAYLAAKVPDPDLRAKLTPAYRWGCKRVLQSNDWYDALVRDNVEVVTTPIEAIAPEGVRTTDGTLRKADVVIYGTGFTPTDYLASMRVAGTGGRMLAEAWRDGAEAYLGITVAGFPNFFIMYGPNTNTVTSIIFMLENQARYIVSAVGRLARTGGTMDLRPDVLRRYNDDVQRRLNRTVLVDADCASYFRTASGKVTTNWPGWLTEYWCRTRRVRPRDYEFAQGRTP